MKGTLECLALPEILRGRLFVTGSPGEDGAHLDSLSEAAVAEVGGSLRAGGDAESGSDSSEAGLARGGVDFSDLLTLDGVGEEASVLGWSWAGEVALWLGADQLVGLESGWALGDAGAASLSDKALGALWSDVGWGDGLAVGSSVDALASLHGWGEGKSAGSDVLLHGLSQGVVAEEGLVDVELSVDLDDFDSGGLVLLSALGFLLLGGWLFLWLSDVW